VLRDSLGGERATVSVDVSLAMDEVKRTLQKVMTREDGSGWVKRHRETRNATSADGDYAGESGSTVETEYDLGRMVEEIVARPGGIERLSVGVLLAAPLEDAELAKIREIVAMTVGLSPERGDSIAVHAIERRPELEPLASAPAPAPRPAPVLERETRPLAAAQPAASWSADGRWAPVLLAVLAGLAALAGVASWRRTGHGLSLAERKSLLAELRGWLGQGARDVEPGKRP